MIARGDVTVLTMTRAVFESMFGPLQVRAAAFARALRAPFGACFGQARAFVRLERRAGRPALVWFGRSTPPIRPFQAGRHPTPQPDHPLPSHPPQPAQDLLNAHNQWRTWLEGQRELLSRSKLLGANSERVLAVGGARTPPPSPLKEARACFSPNENGTSLPSDLAPRRAAPTPQAAFDPARLVLKGALWVMAGYQALAEVAEAGGAPTGGAAFALTARVLSVAGARRLGGGSTERACRPGARGWGRRGESHRAELRSGARLVCIG
jgi:hypothetical protein